jgi:hypothetical protein
MIAGIAVKIPQQTNERMPRIKLQTAVGALCSVGTDGAGEAGGGGVNGGGGGAGGGGVGSAMRRF